MRYIKKRFFLLSGALIFLALFSAIAQQVFVHWRINNTVMNLQGHANVNFNVVNQLAQNIYQKISVDFLANNEFALPQEHLFISQRLIKNSLSDLPNNTKNWQDALYLEPKKQTLTPIKMRLRSGNPVNWMFNKKSWRIKFKKSDIRELTRVFNYVNIQDPSFINGYMNHTIFSELLGLKQHAELIELFINNVSSGIYLRLEHLDESFLRKNDIMPVNIYKGEFFNEDRIYGFDSNLFNNPQMWKKTSIFNQKAENDFSDLERFFTLIKFGEHDDGAYNDLTKLAPFGHWAKVSIAQDLTQNWHNDDSHNMRLVSDPWKGQITMLPHDSEGTDLSNVNILHDKASQPHLRHYLNDSKFLFHKQQQLKQILESKKVTSIIKKIETETPMVEVSAKRDPNRFRMRSPYLELDPNNDYELSKIHKLNIAKLKKAHAFLYQKLMGPSNLSWTKNNKTLSITLDGYSPISSIKLFGDLNAENIYFDVDGNQKISSADIKLPLNSGVIQATLFANRDLQGGTLPTTFSFIVDSKYDLTGIEAVNPFSKKTVTGKPSNQLGVSPRKRNLPIIKVLPAEKIILEGNLLIEKTRIFTEPVKILAGTNISLTSGSSLIFKNTLEVNGTKKKPVTINGQPASDKGQYRPWGVLAISGPNSSGSEISYLNLNGGSGDTVEGIRYIGMLSIHNTSNIKLVDTTISQNHLFDDMVHIIYSNNVTISRAQLTNAFSDGIDVDKSTARLEYSSVEDSGNDAVDLMASSVMIENSSLTGNGDKGVSVGEGSSVVIKESLIEKNKTGIEVKDKSEALILNNSFMNNETQLRAYKKNWRYGGGGKTVAVNNNFLGSNNTIMSDKHSKIYLFGNNRADFQLSGKKKNITISLNNCIQEDCVNHLLSKTMSIFPNLEIYQPTEPSGTSN